MFCCAGPRQERRVVTPEHPSSSLLHPGAAAGKIRAPSVSHTHTRSYSQKANLLAPSFQGVPSSEDVPSVEKCVCLQGWEVGVELGFVECC